MESAAEENPSKTADKTPTSNNAEENPKTSQIPDKEHVKKSKKEERLRSKEDKNFDQFMKSLNSIPTLEEKFSTVCKKYTQTVDENKKLHFYIKQSDKRYTLLLKEKEQLQHESNKTVLVKSKLENLCRELQKQNKAIKEESLLKIREEEERRKETQAKFQNTLSEITTLLQQNNEKNSKLRDDNISMNEKFKSVVQQYQLREQQVDKMAKQMSLESQLADAKLQKASLEHQAERERLMAELEQMNVTLAQYRAKVMELQNTETALRGQLTVYTDKYDEFQTALVKSNQVFGGFKEQMDMMSKKIKKLEKESLSWKKKWETSQTALLDMCGERQANEERSAATNRQLHHMQSLCRTLQAERTLLLGTLKENNIERPPLPQLPAPPPAPAPANNDKVDAMAANCVQLRQSLAHLQSQLNVLTNKSKEEPPKPEPKQKKSKSKKNKGDKQTPPTINEQADTIKESIESDVKETANDDPSVVEESQDSNVKKAANNEPKNIEKSKESNVNETANIESNVVEESQKSNVKKTADNEPKVIEKSQESKVKETPKNDPKVIEDTVSNKTADDSKTLDNLIQAVDNVSIKVADIDETKEGNKKVIEIVGSNEIKNGDISECVNETLLKVELNNSNLENSLNVSHDISSNDEISHIPEVKPISEVALKL